MLFDTPHSLPADARQVIVAPAGAADAILLDSGALEVVAAAAGDVPARDAHRGGLADDHHGFVHALALAVDVFSGRHAPSIAPLT